MPASARRGTPLLQSGAVDVVVSCAVDRPSRNRITLAVLLDEPEQAGARLEFVTETLEDSAIGRPMLSVRAFAAELEREKIAERTTHGKLERARSGRIPRPFGRDIYGYVSGYSRRVRRTNSSGLSGISIAAPPGPNGPSAHRHAARGVRSPLRRAMPPPCRPVRGLSSDQDTGRRLGPVANRTGRDRLLNGPGCYRRATRRGQQTA